MNSIPELQLKFITDSDFRQKFLDDPAPALRAAGIQPTDELLNILAEIKRDLERLDQMFGLSVGCP